MSDDERAFQLCLLRLPLRGIEGKVVELFPYVGGSVWTIIPGINDRGAVET